MGGGRTRFALGMNTVTLWRRLVLGPSGCRLASERAASLAQARTGAWSQYNVGLRGVQRLQGPKEVPAAALEPPQPEGGAAGQKEAAGAAGHPALPCGELLCGEEVDGSVLLWRPVGGVPVAGRATGWRAGSGTLAQLRGGRGCVLRKGTKVRACRTR